MEWWERTIISVEWKNKIDSLWDVFASSGLTNPLEVIEQITYLTFTHDLDETDNKNACRKASSWGASWGE